MLLTYNYGGSFWSCTRICMSGVIPTSRHPITCKYTTNSHWLGTGFRRGGTYDGATPAGSLVRTARNSGRPVLCVQSRKGKRRLVRLAVSVGMHRTRTSFSKRIKRGMSMHRQNTNDYRRGMSTPRQNTTKQGARMSTPRQKHVGMKGYLDGRGNPVVGRPPPPTNWDRTLDNLTTETTPLHWFVLVIFGAWFVYLT